MKKIAKLTWLHNGNYGTVLQAFALQRFLRDNGIEAVDLDYSADAKTKLKNLVVNRNSPELFVGKFREALGRRKDTHSEQFAQREKKFNAFLKNNMELSRRFRSPEEIKQAADEYDVFICGSDQIWSPYLMNPVFYLDFLPENKKRISYATSFGVTSTTKAKEKKICGFLDKFQSVSVRETQGQDFVRRLTGREVPVCIDPTLLLKSEDWNKYAAEPLSGEKYIFAFLLTPNPVYIQAVREFAAKKSLKVITVPTMQGPFDTGFDERIGIGPDEWLSLIKNAEYVFTDSFHCFIFSLIFEREMYLFKRFSDNAKRSQNSRIYTLTSLLGLEHKIISEENLGDVYKKGGVDYVRVKAVIEEKRLASARWILDAVEQAVEQL